MQKSPEGVRLVVDPETGMPGSLAELQAEIQGPIGTPYESKHFQLKLVLSADFPASPPRGFFLTKIYHPNVDMSTGAICVNTLKKDWIPSTSFAHVLSVVRCLLIVPFPESSLNDEAGRLFMDSYEEYARRARLMADVHGRPRPFTEMSNADDNGRGMNVKDLYDSPSRADVKMGRLMSSSVSSSTSSMPPDTGGRSMSINNGRSTLNRSSSVGCNSAGGLRVGGNKSAGEKKSKKKGLKRL